MADFDAIIVGAGHNGLVLALYLTRAGWRVLVVEASEEVGGGLRSGELTLKGYCHDRYATSVGLFAGSPAYHEFKSELDAHGVRFLTSDASYANVFSERAVRVCRDIDDTADDLAKLSPSDADGWRRLNAFFRRTAPRFLPLFSMEMPSASACAQAARIVGGGPVDAFSLAQLCFQRSVGFAGKFLPSPEAQSLVSSWAYHADFGPDTPGGALFGFVSAAAAQANGIPIVEGGAGQISNALRALIESGGGKVLTSSPVAKIIVSGGKARAVRLWNGEEIEAERAVVANVTVQKLFGNLVAFDDLPGQFIRGVENYAYSPATFIVHLALDCLPTWRLGEDLSGFTYMHINSGEREMSRTYRDSLAGLLPERPLLIVSQTTLLDPTRAPPRKHIMRIHVRTVPSTVRADAAGTIQGRHWGEIEQAYADRILDLVEEHVPDLRRCIAGIAVQTPDDIEADNANFVGGDCLSGSHHLRQNFFFRPIRGWSRYRTPIDRLYMIGAATWPGSGANARSGYLLAKALIEAGWSAGHSVSTNVDQS